MTWPGRGCSGQRLSEGHGRPCGCPYLLPVLLPACLLFAWAFLLQSVVADEERDTLPDNDPCFVTLEGYKRYFGPLIDNYFLIAAYKKHSVNLERWQRCCPGGEKTATKFRPKNADEPQPKSVDDIPLPPVFALQTSCWYGISGGYGEVWRRNYSKSRSDYWETAYAGIANNLNSCCVKHLNTCLEKAFQQEANEAGRQRMSAESTRCLERFSPEYEAKAEKPPDESPPQPTKKEEEEAARTRQAAACSSDLARVRKEHDQSEQQAQADKAEITRLTEAHKKSTQDIRDVVAKTAPRPGSEVLAGFPSGTGSAGLVFFGIVVLTAGYFLGWPGRSRGARRNAGAVSVMVALFVYLVSVALLPDTQFFQLLLAATAAVLVVAFRALARSQLELRLRGPTPPSP